MAPASPYIAPLGAPGGRLPRSGVCRMQLWRSDRNGQSSAHRSGKDEELLDAYSSAVVGVVEAVSPSVVHVQVRGSRGGQLAQGSGSGTILSPDGIVLTNNHVVEGASAIELALNDARRMGARVL